MAHRLTAATIDSEAALRELIGEPLAATRAKIVDHLTPHTRRFGARAVRMHRDNRRARHLRNILENPRVALLFIIPGIGETVRVNDRATLVTDAALLAPSTVEGKPPKLGIVVDIEAAYTQCPPQFVSAPPRVLQNLR